MKRTFISNDLATSVHNFTRSSHTRFAALSRKGTRLSDPIEVRVERCGGGRSRSRCTESPSTPEYLVSRANRSFMPTMSDVRQLSEPGVYFRSVRFRGAVSTGRCNTCVKSLCRRFELQRFAGPFVELPCHLVQMRLRVYRQVGARLCLESGGNWFWRLSERAEFCGGQAARSRVSSAIS